MTVKGNGQRPLLGRKLEMQAAYSSGRRVSRLCRQLSCKRAFSMALAMAGDVAFGDIA
jgi:hypothetical protein